MIRYKTPGGTATVQKIKSGYEILELDADGKKVSWRGIYNTKRRAATAARNTADALGWTKMESEAKG